MLLRRITQHIKNQNWFAVFIDFVIVVVGVFIGIQVANWNEERADRVLEAQFLKRLYEDTERSNELVGTLLGRHSSRFGALASGVGKLEADKPQPLTDEECTAIAASAFPSNTLPSLPSVEELRATNGLGLIQDTEVLSLLSNISQTKNLIDEGVVQTGRYIIDPVVNFSQYIKLTHYYDDNEEVRVKATCDHMGMRTDQEFINVITVNLDYQDLMTRRILSVETAFSELQERLKELVNPNMERDSQ
ncbi:MAG: hypothetical protein HWE16_05585 [Gammaproteobacteria bacterium]|nr:hypothetical protein [Gammaproteobacteria bacterium]